MSKVIGIDLGTTNSVVAVMEGGEPTVITNPEGSRLTPSVVAFTKSGERLVGQVAKRQAATNAENTVYSIKRFMGRRFEEVSDEMKLVPYHAVKEGADVRIEAGGQKWAPPQISAMVLQKLKQAAEEYLGQPVTQAVITVPGVLQRRAAPGHHRSRPHRRSRGQAHRQRADGRGAGLRPRQEGRPDDRRVRLRRRHVRHLDPRGGRGRGRGQVDQRRHAPRWRQPRSARDRVDHRGVQEAGRHRPEQGPHGVAAPARGGGEGQDRALEHDADRHQPAVHHRRCVGRQAPVAAAVARQVRVARRRPAPAGARADAAGAHGCGPAAVARSTRWCSSAVRRACRACSSW